MDADVPAEGHAGRRGDTRARIQRVALELFAEQGYDATSLREIAERLGVTKAALYYHFKSKEDIVRSFSEDHFSRMDSLIDWARQQPPGPATGHEILERYLTILMEGSDVFRFLEQNQATLRSGDDGKHRFEQFRPRLYALVDLLIGPDATTRATGPTGTTPPSGTIANSPGGEAGFAFMWHSHNEREITTNNIFPGGMMMMMLVDSREFVIDESN